MEPSEAHDLPNERDTARGYSNNGGDPSGVSTGVLRAISLLTVLALVLAGSSVIIFNTDGGLWVVLLIIAIAAALLVRWGFRSRSEEPTADR